MLVVYQKYIPQHVGGYISVLTLVLVMHVLSPTSLGKRCRTHQTDELRKWPQNTQNSQTKPFTLHTIGVQSY